MIFKNRQEAGEQLAAALQNYATRDDLLVLALPRGGVPVGYEIAKRLGAPLDVFGVRKLGVPGHEELAMGAVASGGIEYLDERVIETLNIPESAIEEVVKRELEELRRREEVFRQHRETIAPHDRCVILVDDGVATGSTMLAAIAALRKQQPAKLVVAVPVAAQPTINKLEAIADDFICLHRPYHFIAVGQWYEDFSQISDEDVRALLIESWEKQLVRTSFG